MEAETADTNLASARCASAPRVSYPAFFPFAGLMMPAMTLRQLR